LEYLLPSLGEGCQAKTGEATSIIAANNPKSTINLLNFFSFLRSTYTGSVSNVLQRKDHQ
jgi:hypothetical protein